MPSPYGPDTIVLLGGTVAERRAVADSVSRVLGRNAYASCSVLGRRLDGEDVDGDMYAVLCGACHESWSVLRRVAFQSMSPLFVLDHPANWDVDGETARVAEVLLASELQPTYWVAVGDLRRSADSMSFAGADVPVLMVGLDADVVAGLLMA